MDEKRSESNDGLNSKYNNQGDNEGKTANERRRKSYYEETAAEFSAPVMGRRAGRGEAAGNEDREAGRAFGLSALALSILAMFILPLLFGAAGIVLGFLARRRGADSLGAWAIGLGIVAIVIGLIIAPFF
ncbi:hypothetical protein CVD28_23085 [Bacillus sp. M6-12]|uniref:hypothetical protein n=1 Tax=Bacillus sp. M6-12 TaxID=2054166 RepID=UPI000C77FB4B|nr:hypothetical protein [Bacillus sp. M6-12]PLS15216.1 hypothetical protein CVD28_23085 [Bacillus sp. M6-12]